MTTPLKTLLVVCIAASSAIAAWNAGDRLKQAYFLQGYNTRERLAASLQSLLAPYQGLCPDIAVFGEDSALAGGLDVAVARRLAVAPMRCVQDDRVPCKLYVGKSLAYVREKHPGARPEVLADNVILVVD